MTSKDDIARLLETAGGLILRREHPGLGDALTRLVAAEQLVTVLPGVFLSQNCHDDPDALIRAVARWDPDAIFTGAAAARLSYWPEVRLVTIDVASRIDRRPRRGFSFSRRDIPAELTMERTGLRFTSPALTALDLADLDHTDAIDVALRQRAATLDALHEALRLTPGRAGNAERRRVLLDSRDEPWSRAEREAHRLLHRAGVSGWKANLPCWADGSLYYLDIAFERLRLVIEIDGRFHEDDPDQFESDRWRQNALVHNGWTVLRFTWAMLRDYPEQFVLAVQRAIQDRRCARA